MLGNEIALNFTKNQILDMYVNRIFYGNFAVGIGTAAQLYFLKPASQLDLAQASMLAGLPQSPSAYNPLIHDRERGGQSARQIPPEGGPPGDAGEWLHHPGAGRRRFRRER